MRVCVLATALNRAESVGNYFTFCPDSEGFKYEEVYDWTFLRQRQPTQSMGAVFQPQRSNPVHGRQVNGGMVNGEMVNLDAVNGGVGAAVPCYDPLKSCGRTGAAVNSTPFNAGLQQGAASRVQDDSRRRLVGYHQPFAKMPQKGGGWL